MFGVNAPAPGAMGRNRARVPDPRTTAAAQEGERRSGPRARKNARSRPKGRNCANPVKAHTLGAQRQGCRATKHVADSTRGHLGMHVTIRQGMLFPTQMSFSVPRCPRGARSNGKRRTSRLLPRPSPPLMAETGTATSDEGLRLPKLALEICKRVRRQGRRIRCGPPEHVAPANQLVCKFTVDVPPGDTSTVNFQTGLAGGVQIFRRPTRSITLSTHFLHISNASLGNRNPSYNITMQFRIGYQWWGGARQ